MPATSGPAAARTGPRGTRLPITPNAVTMPPEGVAHFVVLSQKKAGCTTRRSFVSLRIDPFARSAIFGARLRELVYPQTTYFSTIRFGSPGKIAKMAVLRVMAPAERGVRAQTPSP